MINSANAPASPLFSQAVRAVRRRTPARYVAKLGVELPGVFVSIRMTAFLG
ncbi:MAG TPA: hypothetical protein VGK79_16355 [Gaiellaceae bacterium]